MTKKKNILNTKVKVYQITVLFIGFFYLLSIYLDKTGLLGNWIKTISFLLLGKFSFILPVLILISGFMAIHFKNKSKNIYFFLVIFSLISIIFLDGINPTTLKLGQRLEHSRILASNFKGGGLVGALLGNFIYKLFGIFGSYLIFAFVLLISFIVLFDFRINFKKNIERIKNLFDKKQEITDNDLNKDDKNIKNKKEEKTLNIVQVKRKEVREDQLNNSVNNIKEDIPLELLEKSNEELSISKEEVKDNIKRIEETLANFSLSGTINSVNVGPTITCYELEPAPGIKLNKIVSLSDNLALSLASSDIRIEAPIPGKSAVGIEVPNKRKTTVKIREILSSDKFRDSKSKIPLALGKNVSGDIIVSEMEKMPHLLIAGATGSGKSVCINSILLGVLYHSSPEEVKLVLIDPKVVELSVYNGIPHLLDKVISDPKEASRALSHMVVEMEKRYELFANRKVRDIEGYNKENKENKLPYILIIIDELADLMMVSGKEIEDYICRLAQKARACGIHMIVATQRPSVDVITGTIKANIPSRISFAVSSQVDSRTILDVVGAEKLLGQGDMLFYPSSESKPSRIQGAFVTDEEVLRVVNYLKPDEPIIYNNNLRKESEIELKEDRDDLIIDALEMMKNIDRVSISMFQNKFSIGYPRASSLMDNIVDLEVVGEPEGNKGREVLVSRNELEVIINELSK